MCRSCLAIDRTSRTIILPVADVGLVLRIDHTAARHGVASIGLLHDLVELLEPLCVLMRCDVFDGPIDLSENLGPATDATSVLLGEDVLVVVFELLAAHGTDYVAGARSWLFDVLEILFFGLKLLLLILDIF